MADLKNLDFDQLLEECKKRGELVSILSKTLIRLLNLLQSENREIIELRNLISKVNQHLGIN